MDARTFRVLYSFPRGVDVARHRSCERADDGAIYLACDPLHGLKISGRACGETGLDYIDAKFLELPRNPELFVRRQARACGLLTVPEGGVKNYDLAQPDQTVLELPQ